METGTVKWFKAEKGFGFINPDQGGEDVFVHHSAIVMEGYRKLEEGDRVTFERERSAKGFQARDVRLSSDLPEVELDPQSPRRDRRRRQANNRSRR